MAAPTIFRSTDASAPALNGNAGSLVNVLDWCLDTGTNAGALGWGIAFTAANKRVYRAPAGVRHYLDVDDSGPDATALGRNARCRGYEVMTAVGTGTGPFPTVAQAATPVGIVKSTATGTTARPWLLIGDDRTFHLFVAAGLTDPPTLATNLWDGVLTFGEFLSALTGDLYRSTLGYSSGTSTAVVGAKAALTMFGGQSASSAALQVTPRSYPGTGGAIWNTIIGNFAYTPSGNGGVSDTVCGAFAFPNAVDGGLYMNALDLAERGSAATPAGPTSFRGRVRGLYQPAHLTTIMNDQDTFTGVGDFAGRTFMILKYTSVSGVTSGVVAETTAWAASS